MSLLPVLIVQAANAIFLFPVIVKKLENKPDQSEFVSAGTPRDYRINLNKKIVTYSITGRNLQNLILNKSVPPFIDSEFCLDFFSKSLTISLDKFWEFSPKSKKTQSVCDYSQSEDIPSISYLESTSEEPDNLNIASLNLKPDKTELSENQTENINNLSEIFIQNSELSNMSDIDESTKSEKNQSHQIIQESKEETCEQSELSNPKMKSESNKTPKIKLTPWKSASSDGDPIDWLKVQLYIIYLERGSLSDGAIIQMLLAAITATELRMKIISELSKLSSPTQTTIKQFEDIFKQNVKRDVITYRNYLRNLKYSEDCNMREFYSKIFGLVSKSMELDELKDALSIEKLSINEFISKIPSSIREALQSSEYTEGFELAQAAERIRSYQRVYLDKQKSDINHMQIRNPQKNNNGTKNNYNQNNKHKPNQKNGQSSNQNSQNFQKNDIECYFCHKKGHKKSECYTFLREKGNTGNTGWNNQNRNNQNRSNQNRSNYYSTNQNSYNNNRSNQFQNKICGYCHKNNHTWEVCRKLNYDISRGETSPNWAPPRKNTNHMVAHENEKKSNLGGREVNPLFQNNTE